MSFIDELQNAAARAHGDGLKTALTRHAGAIYGDIMALVDEPTHANMIRLNGRWSAARRLFDGRSKISE